MHRTTVAVAAVLLGWSALAGCAHAPARCPDQSSVVCMTNRVCRTDSSGCQVCQCEAGFVPPESTAPPGQPPFSR